MIEVRHRHTGELLFESAAATPCDADLRGRVLMFGALPGVDLRNADLRGIDLCNADLAGARFDGASLVDATMNASDARGSSWAGVGATFSRVLAAHFEDSDLRRADFGRASLIWVFLSGADLRDARFEKADLSGATLAHAKAAGADFPQANLRDAKAAGADFRAASFPGAVLTGADFSGASLAQADLSFAVFQSTNLAGANLAGAILSRTVFAWCPQLAQARGLDQVRFNGPIALDAETLRACGGLLPPAWLEAAGVEAAGL